MNNSKTIKIIGVNSGTSADSLDVSLVKFKGGDITLLNAFSFNYPSGLRNEILSAGPNSKVYDIELLNLKLGEFVAKKINQFISKNNLSKRSIDGIGMHGQTIHHSQDSGRTISIQITEADIVSARTGITTIYDFRKKDIAMGGAGAPLAPILDYYLFPSIKRPFICQNLGGIANSTLVSSKLSNCIGYDSGPANCLIDKVIQFKSNGEIFYDKNGAIATSGTINNGLLRKLLRNPFFSMPPPKSTGNKEFGIEYARNLYTYSKDKKIKFEDLVATLSMATVETIASSYEKFIFPYSIAKKVIISGGGVNNNYIMNNLSRRLPDIEFIKSDKLGIPSKYKETILFALLCFLRLSNKKVSLKNLTGSNEKLLLGKISNP